MPQGDLNVANQSGAAFRADLNNQLLALGTMQSGAAEPAPTYAYMLWADMANSLLKQRNGANNAWITIGQLDTANLGLLSAAAAASTYAPLASPTFTGTPSVPTASTGTSSTVAASTAYVAARVAQDAPAKDGTGATGTWGINISGNAATATSATTATNATNATNLTGTSTTNINSAALGAGTADGTTFLRGDRTWQVVSTAPTTAEVLTATAGAGVGDVGTYSLLVSSTSFLGTRTAPGGTIAGSSLRYVSLDTTGAAQGVSSPIPAGTWRCMAVEQSIGKTSNIVTFWLRIS